MVAMTVLEARNRPPALSDASTACSSVATDRCDEEDDRWSTSTTSASAASDGLGSGCSTVPNSPRAAGSSNAQKSQVSSGDASAVRIGCFTLMVVICGSACQAPYEVMNSRDKGCIHLIGLIENLFSILMSGAAMGFKKLVLPWHVHARYAAAEVGYLVLMSTALTTTLPAATVIRMRSGGLVASMLLEACALHRKHTWRQRLSVLVITLGLVATSLAGHQSSVSASAVSGSSFFGVLCVTAALLCRATSTIMQEVIGRTYVGSFHELILVRCFISFPCLLLKWPKIVEHAVRWTFEPEISGLVFPSFWLLLLTNMIFDYGTKMSIMKLVGLTSSLTTTLALTIQRFVSFMVSVALLSSDDASVQLWLGAVAVLVGTICYVLSPKSTSLPLTQQGAKAAKNE